MIYPFATCWLRRYKDDAELNEELKARERWNDPAAIFLPKVKKVY